MINKFKINIVTFLKRTAHIKNNFLKLRAPNSNKKNLFDLKIILFI